MGFQYQEEWLPVTVKVYQEMPLSVSLSPQLFVTGQHSHPLVHLNIYSEELLESYFKEGC